MGLKIVWMVELEGLGFSDLLEVFETIKVQTSNAP